MIVQVMQAPDLPQGGGGGGGGGGGSHFVVQPGHKFREFDVPDHVCGHLIGKQGVVIAQLRQETSCNIEIAKDGPNNTRKVMISAVDDGLVENAYKVIMKRIEDRAAEKGGKGFGGGFGDKGGGKGGKPDAANAEFLLKLPPHATGRLIGTQGASIKKLKEMHPSTKINVDNDMCALDSSDKAELERAFNACCDELEGREYTIVRGPGGKSNVEVNPKGDKGKGMKGGFGGKDAYGGKDFYGGGFGKDGFGKDG